MKEGGRDGVEQGESDRDGEMGRARREGEMGQSSWKERGREIVGERWSRTGKER